MILEDKMYCPQCRKPVRPAAKFCGQCGQRLPESITGISVEAPQPNEDAKLAHRKMVEGVLALIFVAFMLVMIWVQIRATPTTAPVAQATDIDISSPSVDNPTSNENGSVGFIAEATPTISMTTNGSLRVPPEDFIYAYYELINSRNYAPAWASLSESFVDQLGRNAGHSYDFTNDYCVYWDTVARMDVLAVELERMDMNFAVLNVNLRWNMINSASSEFYFRYYLIPDSTNSWLIHSVENLN